MMKHSTFQIKAVFFEVSKHLFDPHPSAIISHGQVGIRQIGGETPRFLFANLPVNQNGHRIHFLLGQIRFWKPSGLSSLLNKASQIFPARLLVEPQSGITFLAQDIEPMPYIELPEYENRAKFAVSDQKNGCFQRDQTADILQQLHLPLARAVTANVWDPSPGNRNRSVTKG